MSGVSTLNWRKTIYTKLKERNKREHESFSGLLQLHNRLFEQAELYRAENVQLTLQNEKIRQENVSLLQGGATCSSTTSINTVSSTAAVQQLEQKIYKLQEELTDIHRRKGENAQQLVELNQCLQERDKLVAAKENRITDVESELMLTKETISIKDADNTNLTAINNLLKDENQTINLTLTTLEEKYVLSQVENKEMTERILRIQYEKADRLNEEVVAATKKRQSQLEEQLKVASEDDVIVDLDDKFACSNPLVCLSSNLPSKTYLQFEAHDGEVNSVIFSPEGTYLATGGSDRKVKLWDVSRSQAEVKGTLLGSNAGITAIGFDTSECYIVGASNDYSCRVWTVSDHRLRHVLTGHCSKVMAAKFLIESNRIVTGSHDRTLKIWDLHSRACYRTIFAGSSCNDLVSSDSSATTIISGHFDKKIRFWDTRTEKSPTDITMDAKITSLALSKDGCYLLSCVRDDSLRLIDLRTNHICATYNDEGFRVGADYTKAVFSPDGAYVAAGGTSGSVFIWDTNTMKLEKTLTEHLSCVISCCWHPNGQSLLSCDRNKRVVCWW